MRSQKLYIAILASVLPIAAATAQQAPSAASRAMTIGEVQIRTNLVNLDTAITQAMEQQAALSKENEYLKKTLAEALEKCGEPCKPKPEAKKE